MRFSLLRGLILFLSFQGLGQAATVYFSNQQYDSISAVIATGTPSQFAYTDAFSDPPYYPYGLAVDSRGNVYVALAANFGTYGYGAIREYNSSGTLVAKVLTTTTLLPKRSQWTRARTFTWSPITSKPTSTSWTG